MWAVLVALVSVLMVEGFASCSSKEARFEKALEQLNKMLPMKLGNGFTMQKVSIDGNELVYEVRCDERQLDMDALEQNKNELRGSSAALLKREKKANKDFASLLEYCQEKDMKIVYRYVGQPSKKTVDIVVNPDEI